MQEDPVISIHHPVLTVAQEQEKRLAESLQAVHNKAQLVGEAIKQGGLTQVLGAASGLLGELRTAMLAPHNYYELYVKVFDEMQHVEAYLQAEYELHGRSLENIYELVQYTGQILPRLYLLITAGSVCIASGEQPALDILRDLLEMCKGVQHPIRGLFLRHYLLTMLKHKLPGDASRRVPTDEGRDGGSVNDTATLLLQNFREMNWLWIRMESKGFIKGQPIPSVQLLRQRLRDRQELRVLVGLNVVRISQLDGVDWRVYKADILPSLLDVVVKYREPVAQHYLFEVIVQVFPDEFHLVTLNELLSALGCLATAVDVCGVLASLMERLGNYAVSIRDGTSTRNSDIEEGALDNMCNIFRERLDEVPITYDVVHHKDATQDVVRKTVAAPPPTPFTTTTYVNAMWSLARLALKVWPDRAAALVSDICCSIADKLGQSPRRAGCDVAARFLTYIVEHMGGVNVVLDMDGLAALAGRLPFSEQRCVAMTVCEAALDRPAESINTIEHVARLLDLLTPLFVGDSGVTVTSTADAPLVAAGSLQAEQNILCRVLHLLDSDDPHVYLKWLTSIRKQLSRGGPERTRYTYPTLACLYMRAALRLRKVEETSSALEQEREEAKDGGANRSSSSNKTAKALRYLFTGDGKGVLEIASTESPLTTFPLYLACATTADTCGLPGISYEVYAEAFALYEAYAANTQDQLQMLIILVNSLHGLRHMEEDSYEVIATKVCQYSSKLVRKQDQSRMVAQCANLFFKKNLSTECHHRILECLQRSLKIANQVPVMHQLPLTAQLLNQFLHFYAANAPGVTAKYVTRLIQAMRDITTQPAAPYNREKDPSDAFGFTSDKNDEDDTLDGQQPAGRTSDIREAAGRYFQNTVQYVSCRQREDPRWEEIEL